MRSWGNSKMIHFLIRELFYTTNQALPRAGGGLDLKKKKKTYKKTPTSPKIIVNN